MRKTCIVALIFNLSVYQIFAQSPNDRPANSTVINSVPYVSPAVDITANADDHAGPSINAGGADAFWVMPITMGGQYEVDTNGSSFDTILSVWKGATLGTQVAADDDSGSSTQSLLQFTHDGTEPYYIIVEGFSGATGTAVLHVKTYTPPPPPPPRQEPSTRLNFQGRLTNLDGAPKSGPQTLEFALFDQATAGTQLWPAPTAGRERHENVTPQANGVVSVSVGSVLTLPASIFGDPRPLYLESVVNGEPLAPREVIRPSPFTQAMIPIGVILPYYGDTATLPANWVPCDGRTINDPQSPFYDQQIPDLRQMFLRGSGSGANLTDTGGQDTIPGHSHYFSDTDNYVSFPRASLNGWWNATQPVSSLSGGSFYGDRYGLNFPSSGSSPRDSHGHSDGQASVSGNTSSANSQDNRPRFFTVHFIIRIR